jgi:putative ABC transport system ATP-binding protein
MPYLIRIAVIRINSKPRNLGLDFSFYVRGLLHFQSASATISLMIELHGVSKEVPSGAETLTILHSLDLTIPDAQFVAVVGPSGSGKSTLLGLIAGLDAPTAGEIRIDGQAITRMSEDELAELRGEKIGFVFQSFHLIPSLTALENILIPMEIAGAKDARSRARSLLEDVDLTARAHHYPSQLSGGERQRVAIARAFANDPSILLADEPTGNLDSRNGRHVLDLMIAMNHKRKATLVLVTHDHDLAAMADRRISLRDGRVVADSCGEASDREAEDTAVEATGL